MKRYINNLRTFTVELVAGDSKRYQLSSGQNPDDLELFIGQASSTTVGIFLKKSGQIYNLSHDDFSYDFLDEENTSLDDAYDALIAALPTGTVPTMPDEEVS